MKKRIVIGTLLAALCLGLLGLYHGMSTSHEKPPVTVSYARNKGLLFTAEKPYVLRNIKARRSLLGPGGPGVDTDSFFFSTSHLDKGIQEILSVDCAGDDNVLPPVPMEYHITAQAENGLLVETYQYSFLVDFTRYH